MKTGTEYQQHTNLEHYGKKKTIGLPNRTNLYSHAHTESVIYTIFY
jgi:hypothetical protein